MRIAVVSSVYGGYDEPAMPVAQDVPCEFVLVTDRPYDRPPWRTVVEPRPQLHPRLAAKLAKCRPDLYADADVYVWVDASVVIRSPGFAWWATTHVGQHSPIAQVPHPWRSSVVDEAEASVALPKYAGLAVREQAAHYVAAGYPDGWGLWATGLIAYRNDPAVWDFGDAWLREQVAWTYQDQISEPPLLHALGLKPVDLPGPLTGHPLFGIRRHQDGT
jgi:hypothetical protein